MVKIAKSANIAKIAKSANIGNIAKNATIAQRQGAELPQQPGLQELRTLPDYGRARLIVFDLDGTLIDSRRDLADATNALIAELGGAALTSDEVTSYVGEGAAVLVRRALSAAGLDPYTPGALGRFLTHYDRRLTAHTRPYEGIPEALDALRTAGCRLAVLTNKPSRQTIRILEQLKLDGRFADVVGGDTTAGRKPDPTGLLQIVARAGATPPATVLVGDSPIDLQTARNAGTGICLARYGFGYRFGANAFRGDELFADEPSQLVEVLVNSQPSTSNPQSATRTPPG